MDADGDGDTDSDAMKHAKHHAIVLPPVDGGDEAGGEQSGGEEEEAIPRGAAIAAIAADLQAAQELREMLRGMGEADDAPEVQEVEVEMAALRAQLAAQGHGAAALVGEPSGSIEAPARADSGDAPETQAQAQAQVEAEAEAEAQAEAEAEAEAQAQAQAQAAEDGDQVELLLCRM